MTALDGSDFLVRHTYEPLAPLGVVDRARLMQRNVLGRRDLTAYDLRTEADDDPAALALALVLDVPRRVVRTARRPLPTWLAVALVVAVARRA